MEEDKNIDDLFRQKIEPYQIDPPEHVWNSLDEKLKARQPKRARKNLRIWISSIAALLIITAGSFLYFSDELSSPGISDVKAPDAGTSHVLTPENKSDAKQVISSPSSSETAAPGNQANRETPHTIQPRGAAVNGQGSVASSHPAHPSGNRPAVSSDRKDNNSQELAGNTKQEKSPVVVTETSAQGTAQSAERSSSVNGNKKTDPDATGHPVAIAAVPAASEQSVSKEPSAGNSKPPEGGSEGGMKQVPAAAVVATETGVATEAEGKEKGRFQEETLAVIPAASPAGSETVKTEDKTNTQAPVTAAQETDAVVETAILTDSSTDYRQEKSSEKGSGKPGTRFSVDLYYSPDLASRKLSKNDNFTGPGASEGMDAYTSEKSNYSYSTGIRLRGEISEKWSVATGCFYSTYSQTSGLNTVYVVSDSTFRNNYGSNQPGLAQGPGGGQHFVSYTSCGTINLQNRPFPMHGPGECYTPGTGDTLNMDLRTTEQLQFISIPLTVRFQLNKQRLAYYAEAGAAINFVYDNTVTSTVNNLYSETNDIVGLKNMNYSMLLSVGIQYRLEHKWNLFAEPNLRYSVTPINENSPVLSYPYFLGLKVGLGYHF